MKTTSTTLDALYGIALDTINGRPLTAAEASHVIDDLEELHRREDADTPPLLGPSMYDLHAASVAAHLAPIRAELDRIWRRPEYAVVRFAFGRLDTLHRAAGKLACCLGRHDDHDFDWQHTMTRCARCGRLAATGQEA